MEKTLPKKFFLTITELDSIYDYLLLLDLINALFYYKIFRNLTINDWIKVIYQNHALFKKRLSFTYLFKVSFESNFKIKAAVKNCLIRLNYKIKKSKNVSRYLNYEYTFQNF
ncbi:hypothetical protein [Guillardia theta]|uniref:Uncharacterized protein n=1 Tax=Guillardia theta TaxID=55529 RepID=Q9AW18_GUITH|nr:hypothetical protein GTHECHR2162 [Guillardia theta]CAC27053.1 hypothetical protein [Guillardia theta]